MSYASPCTLGASRLILRAPKLYISEPTLARQREIDARAVQEAGELLFATGLLTVFQRANFNLSSLFLSSFGPHYVSTSTSPCQSLSI
jgi:hypothetical protein